MIALCAAAAAAAAAAAGIRAHVLALNRSPMIFERSREIRPFSYEIPEKSGTRRADFLQASLSRSSVNHIFPGRDSTGLRRGGDSETAIIARTSERAKGADWIQWERRDRSSSRLAAARP